MNENQVWYYYLIVEKEFSKKKKEKLETNSENIHQRK